MIPVNTIEQLYCRRGNVSQNNRNTNQANYELWATLQAGGEVRLLDRPTFGEVRFLEQQIEGKLEITPAAVITECHNE